MRIYYTVSANKHTLSAVYPTGGLALLLSLGSFVGFLSPRLSLCRCSRFAVSSRVGADWAFSRVLLRVITLFSCVCHLRPLSACSGGVPSLDHGNLVAISIVSLLVSDGIRSVVSKSVRWCHLLSLPSVEEAQIPLHRHSQSCFSTLVLVSFFHVLPM